MILSSDRPHFDSVAVPFAGITEAGNPAADRHEKIQFLFATSDAVVLAEPDGIVPDANDRVIERTPPLM